MEILTWTLEYVGQMLPCMAAAAAVWALTRPARRRRLARRGLASPPVREGALLAFWGFAVGLAALTLFPHDFWPGGLAAVLRGEAALPAWGELQERLTWLPRNLVPFHEIRRAAGSPWTLFLLLGNIAMFVPIGFGAAGLWRGHSFVRALAAGLGGSCAVETVQFFIGRSTDIDDVILNTAGALLGWGLYRLLARLRPGWAAALSPA